MRQPKMSSEPRARRKCTTMVGFFQSALIITSYSLLIAETNNGNMASGPGWCSKLWIGVNGEALIGIELLCFS